MKTDNELIAEFMGINVRYSGLVLYHCDPDGYIDFVDGADTYSPQISWSDLMPVVQKIRLLLNDNELYEKSKERNFWDVIMFSFQAVDIRATYIPVITFVKWYNQEKSNPKE